MILYVFSISPSALQCSSFRLYSAQFNRSMRLKANKMGYSLNQRGLYKDVIRDPSDRRKKLHDGRHFHGQSSSSHVGLGSFVPRHHHGV